jgi:hypothetical protein
VNDSARTGHSVGLKCGLEIRATTRHRGHSDRMTARRTRYVVNKNVTEQANMPL